MGACFDCVVTVNGKAGQRACMVKVANGMAVESAFPTEPAPLGNAPTEITEQNCDILVVGAGPVGLVTAIDLARQGLQVVLLDDDDCLSGGSRALCYAKRTLEVLDRLGCGDRVVDKGVSWNVGKVFFKDEPVYQFNLLPEEGHHRPAFVNLQQY
jgi:3-(3-hydroxy-phenyl)propionate hydroxylase